MFSNLISISILLLISIPLLVYFYTSNLFYLVLFYLTIVISYCNENFKKLVSYIFENSEWTLRPSGAKECSLLNNEDNSLNGFPSGHLVTTSFILTAIFMYSFYYTNTTKGTKSKLLFVILSSIYIMLMMYSRVEKRCHTLLQTIAGLVVGFVLGVVYIRVYRKW